MTHRAPSDAVAREIARSQNAMSAAHEGRGKTAREMRTKAATCLIALVCGCASGDDTGDVPNDAAPGDDRTMTADASGQDAPSADDSPSALDVNVANDAGPNAEPDGSSGSVDGGADAGATLDATTGGMTDAGPPDTGAVDSSFDATVSAAPTTAPTAPTQAASKVISLYSATYAGGTGDYSSHVDSYNATCFGPPGTTLTNYPIAGTAPAATVLEYVLPASSFGIIELIGGAGGTATPAMCNGGTQGGADEVDATAMTHFHVDLWSPQGTTNFQIHLVGADTTRTVAGPGAVIGATAGTDYGSPAIDVVAGAWVSIDMSLSQFGPAGAPSLLSRLALVKIFSSSAGTFFVDNVYFYGP